VEQSRGEKWGGTKQYPSEEKEAVRWNKAVPFRGERGSEVEQSSTLQRRKRQ